MMAGMNPTTHLSAMEGNLPQTYQARRQVRPRARIPVQVWQVYVSPIAQVTVNPTNIPGLTL